MSTAIRLEHLTKFYGSSRGIEDLSLTVEAGEVFGFLGPNGAGKTTTMRVLMGLIKPTSGTAEILGEPLSPRTRSRIGYLPGSLAIYQNQSGRDLLRFYAQMRERNCDKQIDQLAQRLDLDLSRPVKDLSKGNRQKVGVIQALMHEPDVLLLDEPTSGLDPVIQREFEVILEELKRRGAAVLLSSHVLSEVEHQADRVAIINDGRLLVMEQISTLKQRALRSIDLFFTLPVDPAPFALLPSVREAHAHGNQVTCSVVGHETELLRLAVEHGVVSVRTHEPSLDEIFLELVSA